MPTSAPVAIGTRGTVGSLVRKEIDYYNKFELRNQRNSKRTQTQMMEMASSLKVHFKIGFSFLPITWSRKRRRKSSSGGGVRQNMCSFVDVVDGDNMNGIKGFNYTILKEEFDNLHV